MESVKFKIDIGRLHNVYEGKLSGRSVGNTFTSMSLIIGTIQLLKDQYIAVVLYHWNNHNINQHIYCLKVIAADQELEIKRIGFDMIAFPEQNARIIFFSEKDFKEKSRGSHFNDVIYES